MYGAESAAAIRGESVRAVDSDASDELFVTISTFTSPPALFLADATQGPNSVSHAKIDCPEPLD
jgi:hypothetical protein